MANVFDVAKYILDSIGGKISTMKLQKLCYYSQAWTLAWDDSPLFNEDFLRWDNGPVCRELFDIHKGEFCISSSMISDDLLSNTLTREQLANIDRVMEDYGQYSGAELSEITHSEAPWKMTPKDQIITKEVIKDFYSGLL